ncbi:MAG: Ig-like domain-containing protein [Candidatus Hodarchaeota archaeon]
MIRINKAFLAIKKRKRAVSPVIAAILLIGLTVAAGAIVFFIVLPLFDTAPELEVVASQSTIRYSQSETEIMQEGWGEASLTILNSGNEDGEVKYGDVAVEFLNTSRDPDEWEEIIDVKTPDITPDSSLEVKATSEKELNILFKLPPHNVYYRTEYRFIISYSKDESITAREGATGDFGLDPDMPEITGFSGLTNNTIFRETVSVIPSINENSKIKKVEFFINTILNETIEEDPSEQWEWSWNTRNETVGDDPDPILSGLPNGTYELTATVTDYAGLSATSSPVTVIIDNDYMPPTIETPLIVAPRYNGTGEAGQPITVSVNITDNLAMPTIGGAWLYYRINDTSGSYSFKTMTRDGNTYTGMMDSSKVHLPAMEYHILAKDAVGYEKIEYINATSGKNYTVTVEDTTAPNMNHTAVQSIDFLGIVNITAAITDYGSVDAVLNYRLADSDYEYSAPAGVYTSKAMTNSSGIFWATIDIFSPLDGFDYYIEAMDSTAGLLTSDGNATYPHHVQTIDNTGPWIEHTNKSTGTAGYPYEVRANSYDNDRTFTDITYNSLYTNGQLELYYRKGTSTAFSKVDMTTDFATTKTSPEGYKVTSWNASIPSIIMESGATVQYYIRGFDRGFNQGFSNVKFSGTDQIPYSLEAVTQLDPIIERTGDVALRTETINMDTVHFTIINTGGDDGTITHVNVSWSDPSVGLLTVRIPDTQDVWDYVSDNSGVPASSKDSLDIDPDRTMSPSTTRTVDLVFDDAMNSTQIKVNFTVTYGGSGTKYEILTFTTPAAPDYDVAYVSGTAEAYRERIFFFWHYYLDFDITNIGDAVQITKIRLTYSTGETIEEVQWYKGTVQWDTGGGTSGSIIDLTGYPNTPPIFGAGDTRTFTIEFDSWVDGTEFTVTIYFADGSTDELTPFIAVRV